MNSMNTESRFTLQAVLYGTSNANCIVLGGSQSNDHEAWAKEWNALVDGKQCQPSPGLALVKATITGDVVDRVAVDAATVERLLGRSLQDLIAQGQNLTSYSLDRAIVDSAVYG